MVGYGGWFVQWLFRPERLVDYRTGESSLMEDITRIVAMTSALRRVGFT